MPLRLHGVWDSWGIVFDPVPFVCTDGARKVRCWATLEALAKISGVTGLDGMTDPELAELFSTHVERFAEAASSKFERGEIKPDGSVCVTAQDVPAALKIPPVIAAQSVRTIAGARRSVA